MHILCYSHDDEKVLPDSRRGAAKKDEPDQQRCAFAFLLLLLSSRTGLSKNRTMETDSKWAKRLFVSGDRSSVGKSTICLSVLGSLVETGLYQPADLAYIKPASQCQDVQLVTKYCDAHGTV